MKTKILIAFIVFSCSISNPLCGATKSYGDNIYETENAANESGDRSIMDSVIRMISSLFAILALIVACAFILKKLTRYKGTANNGNIAIISSLPLGQKKSMCLVRVSNEILIIGITNTNINLLTKMSLEDYYRKDAEPESTVQDFHAMEKDNQTFKKLFSKLMQMKATDKIR